MSTVKYWSPHDAPILDKVDEGFYLHQVQVCRAEAGTQAGRCPLWLSVSLLIFSRSVDALVDSPTTLPFSSEAQWKNRGPQHGGSEQDGL